MSPEQIGPEIPPEEILSKTEKERLETEVLWEGRDLAIKLPNRQAIPKEEGTHIQVIPKEKPEADWRTSSVKDVLKEGYYALAAARIIADSGRTGDLWANIHWNSRPEFVAGANVYGRKPTSETGWAKPVVMREGSVEVPENRGLRKNLTEFSTRYLNKWEKVKEKVNLFSEGVKEFVPQSSEFQTEVKKYAEREDPWQETALWVNEKFVLVAVDNPHLNGIHLVVHPRESYWQQKAAFRSPWQAARAWREGDPDYVQGFLESLAILKETQKILAENLDKIKFANPEIHYSGNWAKDLLSKEKGGKLSLDEFAQAVAESDPRAAREIKRRYQFGGPEEFGTSMHGHLYATQNANEFVKLPSRPKKEVPEEWESIRSMSSEEVETIRKLLQGNLTKALEQEVKGGLK